MILTQAAVVLVDALFDFLDCSPKQSNGARERNHLFYQTSIISRHLRVKECQFKRISIHIFKMGCFKTWLMWKSWSIDKKQNATNCNRNRLKGMRNNAHWSNMTYLSLKLPLERWKVAAGGNLVVDWYSTCRVTSSIPVSFGSTKQSVSLPKHQYSYFSISITKSCRWYWNNHSLVIQPIVCFFFFSWYSSVAIHSTLTWR